MNQFHLTNEDRLRIAYHARGRSYRATDFIEPALYIAGFVLALAGLIAYLPF